MYPKSHFHQFNQTNQSHKIPNQSNYEVKYQLHIIIKLTKKFIHGEPLGGSRNKNKQTIWF